MKRAYTYALSLALLLSLAACNRPHAEQPDNGQPDPATVSSQADNTPETEPPKAPVPEQLSDTVPAVPAENEAPQDQAEIITQEPAENNTTDEVETQLFTEVNETIYATGTVNLRSGPGTENDKVGSMGKGDSATRTGIGINDADGWSRIQLSDGSIVYVGNSYISTTKPATQQQQSTQSSSQTTQNTTQAENKQTTQQSSETSADAQRKALEDAGLKFADTSKKTEETQSQQQPTAAEIEAHKKATDPGYYRDEHGTHSSAANGDGGIGIN